MPLTWNQPLLCLRRMPSRRSPSRLNIMSLRKSSLLIDVLAGAKDMDSDPFFVVENAGYPARSKYTGEPEPVLPTQPSGRRRGWRHTGPPRYGTTKPLHSEGEVGELANRVRGRHIAQLGIETTRSEPPYP